MATRNDLPATDSATALHELIGDDSTATFENDPTFADSNPTVGGSSENLQTRTDRQEVRDMPSLRAAAADEDDDDLEDEDEDEDDDLDDEDDDDDGLDDEDDDDLDDDEDEDDDDEYEDVDDDDDDDDGDDDDADEVNASPASDARHGAGRLRM